ncbi:hypothetical protein AV530_007646 [Patagioenas fasciata monilis]|uniref:Uncharacterized protein n=1 Tax=Patagioenas fasciata monilis TaxID=372326 RepID=A0A1V4JYK3_PATFA|nr:hypothetical protein AV530_007646 [Patagioenas fasciata monilis]
MATRAVETGVNMSCNVGPLLLLLLMVSGSIEDMLQNPVKPTEKFPEIPNSKFLRFSPFKIIQCLSPVCQAA